MQILRHRHKCLYCFNLTKKMICIYKSFILFSNLRPSFNPLLHQSYKSNPNTLKHFILFINLVILSLDGENDVTPQISIIDDLGRIISCNFSKKSRSRSTPSRRSSPYNRFKWNWCKICIECKVSKKNLKKNIIFSRFF